MSLTLVEENAPVPLVDLKQQARMLKKAYLKSLEEVIDNTAFILGEAVARFEQDFSVWLGSRYAVGVGNGTDAIHLALRAVGIGPGDEVIIPANTFIATAVGVTLAGATPVLVDCDPSNFLMDFNQIGAKISPRTKALIPVHLYGRGASFQVVQAIAKQHGLYLIEDAAQSHGAYYEDIAAATGTLSDAGCFSFYPGKNLGCFGDGGLVTCQNLAIYEQLLGLRNYGSVKKYHHPQFGINSRLDAMQAAILALKLPYLRDWNAKRYQLAKQYQQKLCRVGDMILPDLVTKESHCFHLYVVRTAYRDKLLQYLNQHQIGAAIHYPTPVHLHGAYQSLGYQRGDFPQAELLATQILSLPLYPEMTTEAQDKVIEHIITFFENHV